MSTESKTIESENNESAFFVLRTYEKIKDASMERIKDYNEKYLKKYMDSGKEFNEKYLKKYVDSGKEFKDGLEKDVRKLVDNVTEKGKKIMPEFKIITDLKEKAGKQLKKTRGMVNLPARSDLDKLTDIMDSLNNRVDKLSEKYSA